MDETFFGCNAQTCVSINFNLTPCLDDCAAGTAHDSSCKGSDPFSGGNGTSGFGSAFQNYYEQHDHGDHHDGLPPLCPDDAPMPCPDDAPMPCPCSGDGESELIGYPGGFGPRDHGYDALPPLDEIKLDDDTTKLDGDTNTAEKLEQSKA